jgi:hypothetical protein
MSLCQHGYEIEIDNGIGGLRCSCCNIKINWFLPDVCPNCATEKQLEQINNPVSGSGSGFEWPKIKEEKVSINDGKRVHFWKTYFRPKP